MDHCSICLSKTAGKDVLTDELIIKKQRMTFLEVIEFSLNLQVSKTPDANTKMCEKCVKKLVAFYEFKKLAIKSHSYLRILCNVEIENKVDIVKEETLKYDEDPEVHYESFPVFNELDHEKKILNCFIKNENVDSDDELLWDFKMAKIEDSSAGADLDTPQQNNNCKVKNKSTKTSKRQICEECGKSVVDLKQHLATHNKPKVLKNNLPCTQCNKIFATKRGHKKHMNRHLGIKPICQICGKKVADLKCHVATVHNKSELKHECNVCGLRFFRSCLLKVHLVTHSDKKQFECLKCHKFYCSANSLDRHRRRVHEKEKHHLCHYCSKTFFSKEHLKLHLRVHTNERPYSCECGKAFKFRTTLTDHRLLHQNLKKFICDYCQMAFNNKSGLICHLITHTKVKPHECRFCGVCFGRTDHRNRHERTAHGKETPAK